MSWADFFANDPCHEFPWDTKGLVPRTNEERCTYHQNLCAYRDDDPACCPICHASFTIILATGLHSCESTHLVTDPARREIAREAVERARGRILGTQSSGVGTGAAEGLKGPRMRATS